MNKNELQSKLKEVNKLLLQYNIINDTISTIQKEIDVFKAKIVFVGSFSAGKTALINSILGGDEILKEDISPQTAIATEIIYDSNEQIIRIKKDGTQSICSINEVDNLSTEGFEKYICTLNKNILLQFPDKIIVDMPGFDSGIEAHNRAILQYISEAAAYIFVIDASKGTLSKSSIDFLQEIQEYSQTIKFVLTKCDKIYSKDITSIVENLQDIITGITFETPEILCVSSREAITKDKMISLISNLSVDKLLLQKFGEKILIQIKQEEQSLITRLENINFNSFEIDRSIQKCMQAKQSFENAFRQKKSQISNKLHNEKATLIIQDIEKDLHSQITSLITSAQQGTESFNETINSILRKSFMKSSQRYIDEMYDDLLIYLEKISQKDISIDSQDVADTMKKTVYALETILKSGKSFAKLKKYNSIYKIFSTGLAVTTSIIAPWLEMLIIFLPDIISLIKNLFGESKEENLRHEIENKIIPEICSRLRPEINESMNKLEEQMINELYEQYEKLIENKTNELKKLQAEKNMHITETEEQKNNLRKSIHRLNEISKEIETSIN